MEPVPTGVPGVWIGSDLGTVAGAGTTQDFAAAIAPVVGRTAGNRGSQGEPQLVKQTQTAVFATFGFLRPR